MVGFPCHSDVPFASLLRLCKDIPLLFDPLVSLHDSNVLDRGTVRRYSPRALFYFMQDLIACRLASAILLDTQAHIDYFVQAFATPREKFHRLWVGSDDESLRATTSPVKRPRFTVGFWGTFIPLQGIEFIVEAARILQARAEPVDFILIGRGQTRGEIESQARRHPLPNLVFEEPVPYSELPELAASFDVCLGIFGATAKASRVIPNKVFEALALGRPTLTSESPAIREALVHGHDVWLCRPASAESLADAIVHLKSDGDLRARLACNGLATFRAKFSLEALTDELTRIVRQVLERG
ncbi:MAG: glycosyltransferase [Candidatus Riflebacteria bacterium]|nr:glycosyltransferase [Candidatus Riflebacteria bacterium]